MNTKATADAIAARFTGVTATVNGIAESPAYGPSASLPNNVAKSALLVYPPTGVLSVGVSKLRADELDYAVKLLRDPLGMPTRTDALYAWIDAMRDRVEMQMTLGLAYVAWARPVALRSEIEGEEYAHISGGFAKFDVVELTVRVHFYEPVSTVAA